MKRLTYEHEGNMCVSGLNGAIVSDKYANYWGEATELLAKYEDTGFSPQRILSMYGEWHVARSIVDHYRQLENDGLFIRVPCKVGDTIYSIEKRFYNYTKHEGIQVGIVKKYELDEDRGWEVWVSLEEGAPHTLYAYSFSAFGETVFMDKESAEMALKEKQRDN